MEIDVKACTECETVNVEISSQSRWFPQYPEMDDQSWAIMCYGYRCGRCVAAITLEKAVNQWNDG